VFEEKLSRRRSLARELRMRARLSHCIALTRGQRLVRALLWFCLGAAAAIFGTDWYLRAFPAPVNVLQPVAEHVGERLSVIRFRFEHRNGVASCRVVIFHNDEHTWSVQC
jgi:hypothetical protein